MQIKSKEKFRTLHKIDKRVKELEETIRNRPNRAEDFFEDLSILPELLVESVTLKKMNLLGCKMKIYQERMR